jgi:hypothetical protein
MLGGKAKEQSIQRQGGEHISYFVLGHFDGLSHVLRVLVINCPFLLVVIVFGCTEV